MKNNRKLLSIGLVVLVLSFAIIIQLKKEVPLCGVWRIASYWAGTGISQTAYDTYNIFHHFNIEPISGGYISEVNGMSKSETIAEINEIHAHGDLVVATVGGWGYGSEFNSATNTETKRQTFAEQIAQRVVTYGYDGSVIDWEDGVNNDNLFDLMKKIRVELDKYDTSLMSNIDVCCDVTPSNAARIAPYVNSVNAMDYGSPISSAYNEYVGAGVPASKLIGGIEFGNWANSATHVREAATYIYTNNMRGIETWELGGLTSSYAQAIQDILGVGPALCGTCSCTLWINGNCSAGGCTSIQRQQTRICTPVNCQSQSQCISDASCTCISSWSCTSWSTCSASCAQTRTCTDSNNCGVSTGKPTESQSCTGGNCPASTCPSTICTDNIIDYNEVISILNIWMRG